MSPPHIKQWLHGKLLLGLGKGQEEDPRGEGGGGKERNQEERRRNARGGEEGVRPEEKERLGAIAILNPTLDSWWRLVCTATQLVCTMRKRVKRKMIRGTRGMRAAPADKQQSQAPERIG